MSGKRENQKWRPQVYFYKKPRGALTDDVQAHGEAALPGAVLGHALVDAGVVHGHHLDDEGVQALLTHQHLVVLVGPDGLAVQVPGHVRDGQPAHLGKHSHGVSGTGVELPAMPATLSMYLKVPMKVETLVTGVVPYKCTKLYPEPAIHN